MATKQQLIESITKLLVEEFEPHLVTDQDRAFLEQQNVTWLDQKLKQLMADANVQRQHRQQVQHTIQTLESIQATKTRIAQVQRERELDWIEHEIKKGLATLPERQAEQQRKEQQARAVFPEVCRKNRVAPIEANFKLLLEADLLNSEFEATEAISSNAVTLAPASSEQIAAWQAEEGVAAIEQHNTELLRLADLDPEQLRQRVRQEAEHTRVATAQAEADNALAAAQARDAHVGFPQLPDVWQGHPLDAAFIRNCDATTNRLLIKRFGAAQITARLQALTGGIMERKFTEREMNQIYEAEKHLRTQGLIVDEADGRESAAHNAERIYAFFAANLHIAVTVETILDACERMKDQLHWKSSAQREYEALYNNLSTADQNSFGAWWFLPSTKKTILIEGDEGFSNAAKILRWMHGKPFTGRNCDLAVSNLASSHGSLYWAPTPKQADPRQHSGDGRGFMPKDSVNLSARDHRRAADSAATTRKPVEPDYQAEAESVRGHTHGETERLNKMFVMIPGTSEIDWQRTNAARRRVAGL